MCGRPMACSRIEEYRNTRGERRRSYSETSGEASRSFKAQRPGHRHHTPIKYPSLSPSGSRHSMLGTSPGGSLPLTVTPTTPAVSITSKNTPVETWCKKARLMLNVVSASAQQHVPSLTGHMPAEFQHGSSRHLTHNKPTNPLVNRRQISNDTQQHKLCKLLLPHPAELTYQESDFYLSSLKF